MFEREERSVGGIRSSSWSVVVIFFGSCLLPSSVEPIVDSVDAISGHGVVLVVFCGVKMSK